MAIIGSPILAGGGGSQGDCVDMSVATTLANDLATWANGYVVASNVNELWPSVFAGNASMYMASMAALKSVPDYAFANCESLETFLGEQVEHVGEHAFDGCSYLATVVVDAADIGSSAFYDCRCLNLNLFSSVTSIGRYAFAGSSAMQYSGFAPSFNDVRYIGDHAFEYNRNLGWAHIYGVEHIGSYAFVDTELYLASLSSPYISCISEAFAGCSALQTVYITADFVGDMNSAFYGCVSLYDVHLSGFAVPSGIETAFDGCSSMAYLYVPTSAVEDYKTALPSLTTIVTGE